MQNFPNSPAPPALPPGFTSRGGGGSSYPPQSTDPQISPRMTDDYTGMQQQTPPNPQSHSRHLLHRGHHHPSQAGHMLSYDARNRAGESSHGNIHSGSSSNPYQKETMDYYFAMGGKDRHRRGGMAYGAGFGYSNMDGHIPQQYRQAGTSSGLSSGMMSPYPLDYGSTAGSGGSSSGAGAFSPSHQYKVGQNPAMQPASGPQMQHRQHGQNYPAHQALQHGQQHRTYPISGHRMPPQFSHYSPQGSASTGSSGMYSSPPQRYHDGASSGGGFEPKVNNSPNMNSNSNSILSSATTNNVGSLENVTQSYHSSSYPSYSPQTHSLHKQATLHHRNSQHNLGIGYDNSLKMQHHAPPPGSVYSKHRQSTNPGMPQQPCQETAKSPMHSQPQQGQINQNFSPISNPSPAASAVQSPSCSSSPSPLMGVSEGHGNPSCPPHVSSHPPPPNPRSCRGRLLQTMPQLSPTPNSNSSISSCGSSGSNKATGLNTSAGGGHSVSNRSRMAAGTGKGSHEEGSSSSVYSSSPLDKLMQDPGLNSLNALTSQVANLPNTVQHMLLTDTLMSHRRGKDGQSQMLQALQAIPSTQPRSRSVSAASSSGIGGGEGASSEAGGDEDSFLVSERVSSRAKEERDEQISEGGKSRMRQMSGASSGSEPTGYYPPPSQSQMSMGSSKNQSHTGKSDQGSQGKMMFTESSTKQSLNPSDVSERKTIETRTPSSSSPSFASQSAEPGPSVHSRPPVSSTSSCPIPSPAPQFHPNCVSEPGATDVNTKNGLRKTREIKYEGIKDESGGMIEKNEKGTHGEQTREGHMRQDGQDKENKLDRSLRNNKKGDEKDGKRCKTRDLDNSNQDHNIEEQPNAGGVGVIVSTRCEVNNPEKGTHAQDNCIEEKHSDSFFRESSRHNGEEGMDLSVYSSHHEVPQKSNFGRSVPQNHPPSGAQKYGYQESLHGAAMGLKNRGRPSPGSVTGSNSRYQGFHQPKPNYGPEHTKDVAGTSVEGSVRRREGSGARGHDDNSQLQHPFPSLLQEVLQGYHIDRRYGRSEQALTAHLQAQNMTRQQYQTRHPYGMAESMRTQTRVGEVTSQTSRMTSPGKPLQLNQRQGPRSDFVPESPQSSLRSEGVGTKGSHSASSEKNKMATPQRHPTHMLQSTEFLSGPPTKHINLADYSLPHRKPPPGLPSSSSAVQELLLQETEPLAGSVGTIDQIESQMLTSSLLPPSKERRSVICDVCPNRRSTPERDGEREREREKSPIGASVIQLPSTNDLGNSKEMGDKKEVGMKVASKETAEAIHHSGLTTKESDVEHHNKALHPSVVMNSETLRRGKIDLTTTMPSRHLQQTSHYPSTTNPLSPPSRRQSYPHGVDLSTGHASGFPGSRFGDTREGNMMPRNPHFHNPYHSPQVQLQNPQSANKLQMYTQLHAQDLDDRLDWAATINRPTKDMMQSSTSPGRHKLSHSEQKQRMQSPTDILHNRQSFAKQQVPHQNTYYDMKMWESTHSGRESVGMLEGDPYQRSQQPPPAAPLGPVAPQLVPTAPPVSNILESPVSREVTEEIFKSLHPTPTPNSMKTVGHSIGGNVNSVMPQSHRPNKTGGSGDTNPLMLRRRVRSFISPIPAKRQHQDVSQQRSAPSSYHSPLAYSESSLQNDDDSSSSDITTLGSPNTPCPTPGQSTYSQSSSPVQGKKSLPPRKGRGLKLEAIVQKITPNVKKSANSGQVDVDSNDFVGFSHTEMSQFTDTQDEEECLPYLDESLSLSDIMPYRGVDETGLLPPTAYPCDPHQTSQVLKRRTTGTVTRPLQPDFDFGLGTAASSTGDRDKEIPADFTLLGPLPPPPPLPCPVQGSPPPSSSALSDIQHFTNTYQQLETRRGEQSAANLLRQKLEETGIGFDDYSSSDYYGTTPPHHSQAQGHLLRQPHQTSPRSSLAMTGSPQDSKQSDNSVPKGYFPSGKKKGRPVGSVNKQKRAQATQAQAQNVSPSALSGPPIQSPATVSPQVAPSPSTTASAPSVTPPTDQKMTPPEIPPVLTQAVKVDAESEDTQPETEVKSVCQKQGGVKDESEVVGSRGRRRRRRGVAAAAAKDDLEAATRAGEHFDNNRVFPDNSKCAFAPYIHVERKVAEIGAVCTIVNGEEEKMKGERGAVGAKASSSGIEALLTSALLSQLPRRDREIERVKEKRELEDVDSALQSGKALPSSEYLLPGPVITESIHSGRLLCCLCQKWANYKNLGDLYGPYYPPEYATRLPKNQPQIRQSLVTTGMSRNVQNLDTISNVLTTQGCELQDVPTIKSSTYSDCMFSQETNTTSPATAVGTASPAGGGEMLYLASKLAKTTTNKITVLNWDMPPELKPITELRKQPELQNEPTYSQQNQPCQQQQTEDTQQRPQHRKLTSHPRFKRRQKSSEDSPRMVPSNSKASLPFQPPPPTLDSLGPLAQLAQLPQMPIDPEELWVHEACMVWTSGVYLVNGRLYGLQEALDGARDTVCSYCEMVGSTLGCYSKGCALRYHYPCAMDADCSLNEDNFSLRCPKHKVKRESFPRAASQLNLCTLSSLREAERETEEEETQKYRIGMLGR